MKIGQNIGGFAIENVDGGLAEFNEIVWQNFGGQTNRDSFHTLSQQKWKLNRKGDRFFFPSIVAHLPVGGLTVEEDLDGKFTETGFDVSGSCCTVTCAVVSPVSLGIDEQIFLPHVHHGFINRSITMGMVLHGLSDDVRHFVVASVVDHIHGVHNPSLNRF